MLKLKLQYIGHLMWRADSFEKTLKLGEIEGRMRRGWQRMRWLDCIINSMEMGLGKTPGVGDGQGGLACCDSWGCKESDTTEPLNWTELKHHSITGSPVGWIHRCGSVAKLQIQWANYILYSDFRVHRGSGFLSLHWSKVNSKPAVKYLERQRIHTKYYLTSSLVSMAK